MDVFGSLATIVLTVPGWRDIGGILQGQGVIHPPAEVQAVGSGLQDIVEPMDLGLLDIGVRLGVREAVPLRTSVPHTAEVFMLADIIEEMEHM